MHTKKRLKQLRRKARKSIKSLSARLLLKLRRSPPKVIIMVDGGFCSVLTKYILGQGIQKRTGLKVEYDLTWFNENGKDCDGLNDRPFQFHEVFPDLDFPIASKRDIQFYKTHFYRTNKQPYKFCNTIFDTSGPTYLDGYYEHWKYFEIIKEQARTDLSLEHLELNQYNAQLLEEIRAEQCSVAVHVRRGDFVKLGLCFVTADYYLSAMQHFLKVNKTNTPHFYFFSNDLDWVKSQLAPKLPKGTNYTIVDGNDNNTGYFDLQLIIECKHQISSNSSFGYWGGLLNTNEDKIVIIPGQWVAPTSIHSDELVDSDIAHRVPGWLVFPHANQRT